jgi:hypothetical protein
VEEEVADDGVVCLGYDFSSEIKGKCWFQTRAARQASRDMIPRAIVEFRISWEEFVLNVSIKHSTKMIEKLINDNETKRRL